jgi:hypothetical protein
MCIPHQIFLRWSSQGGPDLRNIKQAIGVHIYIYKYKYIYVDWYNILVGKLKGSHHLGYVRADGDIILKQIYKKENTRTWTRFNWPEQGPAACICTYDKTPSGSIKGEEGIGQLDDYRLLNKLHLRHWRETGDRHKTKWISHNKTVTNKTKLNQLMHKLSHLYCSVLIMPLHMFRTLVHHQRVLSI